MTPYDPPPALVIADPNLMDNETGIKRPRTAKGRQRQWMEQWGDLGTYNMEVARGLMHTPEWQERMRQKQEMFDRAHKPMSNA